MNLGQPISVPDSVNKKRKRPASSKADKNKNTAAPAAKTQTELWDAYWPPLGWPMFEELTQPQGMSSQRCPETGTTRGMSYAVTIEKTPGKPASYALEINEWAYDAQGHHQMTTPIDLRFTACLNAAGIKSLGEQAQTQAQPPLCLDALRLLGRDRVLASNRERTNAALVAAYIAARIAKGLVPDARRILKLYKLT